MPSRVFTALQIHPALARPRPKRARKRACTTPLTTAASVAAAPAKPPRVAPLKTPRSLTVSVRRWRRATKDEAVVPYLRLCGRWLEAHGFPIGGNVHITVEHGRVVLTSAAAALPDASRALA